MVSRPEDVILSGAVFVTPTRLDPRTSREILPLGQRC